MMFLSGIVNKRYFLVILADAAFTLCRTGGGRLPPERQQLADQLEGEDSVTWAPHG